MNATFNSRESILYDIGVKSSLRYQQFVQSESISSPNGNLVVELAQRISLSSPDDIPKPYKRLLGNICKISSVAGFLQILTSESLEILEEYCNQSLDLRSAEHAAKQKMIREEMPALWPNLIDILNLGKCQISSRRCFFNNSKDDSYSHYGTIFTSISAAVTMFFFNYLF